MQSFDPHQEHPAIQSYVPVSFHVQPLAAQQEHLPLACISLALSFLQATH
jgi:hypothetical protein